MRLGVEEDLGVTDVVFRCSPDVGGREVVEIAGLAKDTSPFVVDIQERLEIYEVVSPAQFNYRVVPQVYLVARSQLEHQLRL